MKRERCSAVIITFNEAHNLPACLESLSWLDEVVVVDSGSTDRTTELARKHGCKVLVNSWPGMREQKNLAIEHASHPWIFNIDADERVTPELAERLKAILSAPQADGYSMPRKNIFLGRWMRHGGWYPDEVLRLFRKQCGRFGGQNPHAYVELRPDARVQALDEALLHYTYLSMAQYIAKHQFYAEAAAREIYDRRRPVSMSSVRILTKTIWKFVEVYVIKRGFLDGTHGLVAALGSSFGTYMRQSRLWELCRENRLISEPSRKDRARDEKPTSSP